MRCDIYFTSLCLGLLLLGEGKAVASQNSRGYISGRLVFESELTPCDRCQVFLERLGAPVGYAFSDSFGNFNVAQLQPDLYTVKVNIEGFESVEHRVDSRFDADAGVIMLREKAKLVRRDAQTILVDVSSRLDRYPRKAVALYENARKNVRTENIDAAILELQEAVRIASDFYDAHNELGLLYKAKGQPDAAERELYVALSLNLVSASPLINLSALYIDNRRPVEAVAAAQAAIRRDPGSAGAFLNLGLAFCQMEEFSAARAALEQSLQLTPKLSLARLALANVLMTFQDWPGVRNQLDSYVNENPQTQNGQLIQRWREQIPGTRDEEARRN